MVFFNTDPGHPMAPRPARRPQNVMKGTKTPIKAEGNSKSGPEPIIYLLFFVPIIVFCTNRFFCTGTKNASFVEEGSA